MRRRLFTIASAISLLLCMATMLLWARTYYMFDILRWQSSTTAFFLETNRASVMVIRYSRSEYDQDKGFSHERGDISLADSDWNQLVTSSHSIAGFRIFNCNNSEIPSMRGLTFPLPVIAFIAALASLRWARVVFRQRRQHLYGVCIKCSYNLTGNTSDVCPECGSKIEPERRSSNAKSAERATPRA